MDRLETTLRNSILQTNPTYYVNDTGTCKASSNGALWDYVQLKVMRHIAASAFQNNCVVVNLLKKCCFTFFQIYDFRISASIEFVCRRCTYARG